MRKLFLFSFRGNLFYTFSLICVILTLVSLGDKYEKISTDPLVKLIPYLHIDNGNGGNYQLNPLSRTDYLSNLSILVQCPVSAKFNWSETVVGKNLVSWEHLIPIYRSFDLIGSFLRTELVFQVCEKGRRAIPRLFRTVAGKFENIGRETFISFLKKNNIDFSFMTKGECKIFISRNRNGTEHHHI